MCLEHFGNHSTIHMTKQVTSRDSWKPSEKSIPVLCEMKDLFAPGHKGMKTN